MDNEKEIINDDITGAAELKPQQMEDVPGGGGFLKIQGVIMKRSAPDTRKSLSLDGIGTPFAPGANKKCR